MELPVNVTMPLSISTGLEHSAAGKTDANCALEKNQSLIHDILYANEMDML